MESPAVARTVVQGIAEIHFNAGIIADSRFLSNPIANPQLQQICLLNFPVSMNLLVELKKRVLAVSGADTARVFTDPVVSPTGFPFKVVQLTETLSDVTVYEERTRICDLAYLRHAYKTADGALGWRCSAEPVADYLRKGGQETDTRGRKCICNALMANIGLGQLQRDGVLEKPLITSGDDVAHVSRFLKIGACSYRAADVIEYLLSKLDAPLGTVNAAYA